MRPVFVIGIAFLIGAAPGMAQDKPDQRQLAVRAAPLPEPPMEYRFIPDIAEQTPGNAALLYLMAFSTSHVDSGRLDALEDTPTAKLKEAGAEDFLAGQALAQIRVATHRATCEWDSSYREQGVNWNAAYLNQARWMANVLRVKARLELSQGRFDEAVNTLQDGFTLATNLSHDATVIQALIATGIESALLSNVEESMAAKGAPNLYWALANLPRPLIDRRQVMELESGELLFTFPELRHVNDLTAAQSRRILLRTIGYGKGGGAGKVIEGLALMVRAYPQAREALLQPGIDRATVEAMPANTVVLAYDVMQYQHVAQEFERTGGLPYWQASPLLQQADAHLQQAKRQGNPLVELMPAFLRVNLNYALVDREAAMLACIEGIRAYAAAHDGAAPPNLDSLSPQTPAPIDPVLGKPFEYEIKDGVVTLRAPAPPGQPARLERVYRITLVR